MSVFGPFYPAVLQEPVNHAERLARGVARAATEAVMRRGPPREDADAGELWLIGRAEEIELLVADIVASWRGGRSCARAAAAAITRYLDHFHRGFVAASVDARGPPCCRSCEITVDVDAEQVARMAARAG